MAEQVPIRQRRELGTAKAKSWEIVEELLYQLQALPVGVVREALLDLAPTTRAELREVLTRKAGAQWNAAQVLEQARGRQDG